MAGRLGAVSMLVVLVAACANPAPTSPPSTPSPRTTPMPSSTALVRGPELSCGRLDAGDCASAVTAVLVAVRSEGTPTRVALDWGLYCHAPGLLFATGRPCPATVPPGGEWIGHAQVAFADRATQAYVNVARNGSDYAALVIALATPPPEPLPSAR